MNKEELKKYGIWVLNQIAECKRNLYALKAMYGYIEIFGKEMNISKSFYELFISNAFEVFVISLNKLIISDSENFSFNRFKNNYHKIKGLIIPEKIQNKEEEYYAKKNDCNSSFLRVREIRNKVFAHSDKLSIGKVNEILTQNKLDIQKMEELIDIVYELCFAMMSDLNDGWHYRSTFNDVESLGCTLMKLKELELSKL